MSSYVALTANSTARAFESYTGSLPYSLHSVTLPPMTHYTGSIMSPDFSSFLSSEIFEVTTEQGQRWFLVYSNILTAQSAPLRALVTGNWRESTDRKIDLEGWDGDTVGRFVSFLYAGNYEYPDPSPLSPEHFVSPEEFEPPGNVVPPSKSPLEYRMEDWEFDWEKEDFRPSGQLEECIPEELRRRKDGLGEEARLLRFDLGSHDYRDALLTHARVYALAQYEDVVELRKLSLERLLFTLQRIGSLDRKSHLAANVAELLGYVYAHTDELDNSKDPMRGMVSQFVANNFEVLRASGEISELMKDGGDLVMDLLERVTKRVLVRREELDDDWERC